VQGGVCGHRRVVHWCFGQLCPTPPSLYPATSAPSQGWGRCCRPLLIASPLCRGCWPLLVVPVPSLFLSWSHHCPLFPLPGHPWVIILPTHLSLLAPTFPPASSCSQWQGQVPPCCPLVVPGGRVPGSRAPRLLLRCHLSPFPRCSLAILIVPVAPCFRSPGHPCCCPLVPVTVIPSPPWSSPSLSFSPSCAGHSGCPVVLWVVLVIVVPPGIVAGLAPLSLPCRCRSSSLPSSSWPLGCGMVAWWRLLLLLSLPNHPSSSSDL
jgi:hypothetical protein